VHVKLELTPNGGHPISSEKGVHHAKNETCVHGRPCFSMQRSELPYLRHMVDAVERLQSHLEGVDRTGFDSDLIRQDAVVRQLEILGGGSGTSIEVPGGRKQ